MHSTINNDSEHFGERALVTGEPLVATVVALTDVVAWTLSKEHFQATIGHLNLNDLILKQSDRKLLSVIPLFAYSDIDSTETAQLAEKIVDGEYPKGHVFATMGAMVEPALYIIRSGSVVRLFSIFSGRQSTTLTFFFSCQQLL